MSLFANRTVSIALRITAWVNLGASAAAILQPQLNATLLYGVAFPLEGISLRFHYLLWSTVFAMGLGYIVAARDPEHQSGLMIAAGVGKLSVAAIWLEMLASALGSTLLLVPIAFDGIFGAYFLSHFILKMSRRL